MVLGDLVIVRPGEKIPVDGTVTEGNAYINQAAITGESMPVNREAGETVFSGTVIESGYLKIKEMCIRDSHRSGLLHYQRQPHQLSLSPWGDVRDSYCQKAWI